MRTKWSNVYIINDHFQYIQIKLLVMQENMGWAYVFSCGNIGWRTTNKL